ncbi:MAG: hypothetical protein HQM08_20500 [Candidatus Riflebacteria bacterium]|nr:hypothetical protein [Candidatus Riflebacteria bacterium]
MSYSINRFQLFLMVSFLGLAFLLPAFSAQELSEINMTRDILNKNFENIKFIIGYSSRMLENAEPFSKPNYARRYKFELSDENSRAILSILRKVGYEFKTLSGVTCHTEIKELPEAFKGIFASIDTLDTGVKRSLRAIKDHNSALYIASAQTINKEAKNMIQEIGTLEKILDQAIHDSDMKHEDL